MEQENKHKEKEKTISWNWTIYIYINMCYKLTIFKAMFSIKQNVGI